MQNLLTGFITATLVYVGLFAGGLGVARFLMPNPPNIYRTSVYDMTLPKDWSCELEGSEVVCNPRGKAQEKAILIAAMKFRNPEVDTIGAYKSHLQKIKSTILPDGTEMRSKVERVGEIVLDDRTWIDATHFVSEVPGFRTRYLASLTTQVGIAITFSTREDSYEIYGPILDKIVNSINIYQRYLHEDL
jgi:hypothetical protein